MPGLIPADAQNAGGAPNVGGLEDFDRQPLKKRGEPGPDLRPRQAHLPHAMPRKVDPRGTRVQVGHELATIQMAPDPLLGVITLQLKISLWSLMKDESVLTKLSGSFGTVPRCFSHCAFVSPQRWLPSHLEISHVFCPRPLQSSCSECGEVANRRCIQVSFRQG
jgi:hypothetical protein